MEVDGKEIEIVSMSPNEETGRRLVKTMNKTGNAAGFSRGVSMFDLSISAVIPKTGDPLDWSNIEGAKITVSPVSTGGKRVSYLDCFTTSVGRQYSAENEARIDIKMNALRKVIE